MSRYRIRPAAAADVDFLADVVIEATRTQGRLPPDFDELRWREAYAEWTLKDLRGEVPGSTTSVIEVGDRRVGRLRVRRTDKHIELCGIQLFPQVQHQGIGTAIIEDLKTQAAAAGVPLELRVEKDNPDARRLYERLEFVAVGESDQESRLRWSPP